MEILRVTVPARDPIQQIDWRKEAGDANLCKKFGVAVYNRSKTLCDKLEDKNSSVVYCEQRYNTGIAPKKECDDTNLCFQWDGNKGQTRSEACSAETSVSAR